MGTDENIKEGKSLTQYLLGYIKVFAVIFFILFVLYLFGENKLSEVNNLKKHIMSGGMFQCQNKDDITIYNSSEVYLTEQEYLIDKKTKKRISIFDCIQIIKEDENKDIDIKSDQKVIIK